MQQDVVAQVPTANMIFHDFISQKFARIQKDSQMKGMVPI